MLSAPAAAVAVPATIAPCRPSSNAMARPMPRLAPVTSAGLPSSGLIPPSCLRLLRQFLELRAIFQRDRFQVGHAAFRQSGEHAAGAAFDDLGNGAPLHLLHAFDPAYGPVQLAQQ